MLCVWGNLNLKCWLIEFVIPNLSKIYFWIPEIFKTNVSNRFKSEFTIREHKITIGICVLVLWIHKVYFVVKKAGVKCSYQIFVVYKYIYKLLCHSCINTTIFAWYNHKQKLGFLVDKKNDKIYSLLKVWSIFQCSLFISSIFF